MIDILCACTHPEILNVMSRLVDQRSDWRSSKVDSPARLLESVGQQDYDLILLGAGFGPEERAALEDRLAKEGKHARIITHFGGGSGLLFTEIALALDKGPVDRSGKFV